MPTKAQHEAVIKAAMGGTLVPYISSQHGARRILVIGVEVGQTRARQCSTRSRCKFSKAL
jgi:hypothetical protein